MLLGHAKHAGSDTSDATKRDQFVKHAVMQASLARDLRRKFIGLAQHLRIQIVRRLSQVLAQMFVAIYIQVRGPLTRLLITLVLKRLLIEPCVTRKGKRDNELRPCGSTLVVPRRPVSNGNRQYLP